MKTLRCAQCDVNLVPTETCLEYLGHSMNYEFPRCPICGQVFISEDIVTSKMRDIEISLEDK